MCTKLIAYICVSVWYYSLKILLTSKIIWIFEKDLKGVNKPLFFIIKPHTLVLKLWKLSYSCSNNDKKTIMNSESAYTPTAHRAPIAWDLALV